MRKTFALAVSTLLLALAIFLSSRVVISQSYDGKPGRKSAKLTQTLGVDRPFWAPNRIGDYMINKNDRPNVDDTNWPVADGAPANTKMARISASPTYYQTRTLDINRISISFNNQGVLDFLGTGSGAARWPKDKQSVIVFDQGLWVIGKFKGQTRMALGMWGASYSPGPIINGRPAMLADPADSLRYRVYKISRGDEPASNQDCAEWPSDLGAPIVAPGKIRLLGDQMTWAVYNGADSTVKYWWKNGSQQPLLPLPVEIQQTAYAHAGADTDSSRILANTVFVEWKIVNKGNAPLDSAYVSLWTDIDFGVTLNPPAVDTVNQLGYCWHGRDDAGDFGTRPPAVGYVWLYGPSVLSPGSTAIFLGRKKNGYKNLPMTSFWGILDDGCYPNYPLLGPPCSVAEAWNIARGFDRDGKPIIDPTTGDPTKFPYSGDPVSGTGWLHPPNTGGGAGFNIFSGPFNLAPNDTQWVMVALVPAQGTDRFDSIRKLREYARQLRALPYDSLAKPSIIDCQQPVVEIPQTFALMQNYPNPVAVNSPLGTFKTRIEFQISSTVFARVKVYDITGREVATLFEGATDPGNYEVLFDASTLPNGVYFYRLQAGAFVRTKKFLLLR
jgi:Secretion system C-terminal sorting domain